jgi:hypothetical protein
MLEVAASQTKIEIFIEMEQIQNFYKFLPC